MPKVAKARTAVEIKRINTRGFHAVGEVAGLLLKVNPTGSKSWVLRAMVGRLRRDIGLGGYPTVTLADARTSARAARELIRQGIDPIEERRKARESLKREQEVRITLTDAWGEFWEDRSAELGKKTQAHWVNSIENYALPLIGSKVVSEIETGHIEKVLRPIWETKTMTAKKLRGRLENLLSWATVKGYRTGDNPARWKDNLKEILPKPSKVHKTTHFRALPIDDAPQFITDLKERGGMAAHALEFLILTACRSGEVRGARWDEIDFKRAQWVIPAERMKMDEQHTIPLSEAAIEILKSLHQESELIFPAQSGKQLSDMTLLAVLKRMKYYEKTTVHGFRSVFKSWANQETDYPDFVSEMALAHSVGDSIQKAYKRSDLVAKRLGLMRHWATFLGYSEQENKAKVTELRATA